MVRKERRFSRHLLLTSRDRLWLVPFFVTCSAASRTRSTRWDAPLGGGRSLADQSVDLVHRFCAVLRNPPSSAVHPDIRNHVPSLCSAGKTALLVCRTPPAQQREDIFVNIDQYT